MKTTLFLLFSSLVAANPNIFRRGSPTQLPAAGVTGFGTFNNFVQQVNGGSGQDTDCGKYDPSTFTKSPYAAAVADLSPDLATTACTDSSKPSAYPTSCTTSVSGSVTMGIPAPSYTPPTCKSFVPCDTCFKVTNKGALGPYGSTTVGGQGKCAYVKIIDSCPHNSAYNYCKIGSNPPISDNQRCMAPGKNAMDIDQHAYQALTGIDYIAASNSGQGTPPNLNILVQNIACSSIPADGSCTSGPTQTPPPGTSPTNPPKAGKLSQGGNANKAQKGAKSGKTLPVKKATAPKTSKSKQGRYASP